MSRDPIDQVRQIVLDVTVVATTVAPALHQMGQSEGGYATSVVGAAPTEAAPIQQCGHRGADGDNDCSESRPCPIHDEEQAEMTDLAVDELGHLPANTSTIVEQLGGRSDKALADKAHLRSLLSRMARDAALAAKICSRWGLGGVDASTVKQSLNDALSGIWCSSCSQHGYNNRRTNGEYCEFCSGIKSKYKRYPNGALLAIHATGRRILPSDVKRCFDPPRQPTDHPVPDIADARRRRDKRVGEAS